MTTYEVFCLYINDAMYLGIQELEEHFLNMMENACLDEECERLDFSLSPPNKDFIDRFLREKLHHLGDYHYSLLKLLLMWVREAEVDNKTLQSFSSLPMKIESVTADELNELQEQYPHGVDSIVSANSLVSNYLKKVQCIKCDRYVWKASIGYDKCYYKTSNKCYQQQGVHESA
eukprot:TRINITY_DN60482_c0_g1_i1.p1 TRINITY_DN60482_c0_g1~~TRINITY_DN60482_c0_g1_i1.p1  ORF type:complete len:200 (+),score=13.41 TRINITY_DN60482_c0_g1_i1:81-602(+)